MNKAMQISFLSVLVLLLAVTGCAPKKQTSRQINSLQAQVGAMSDEIARLDQALYETRQAIQSETSHGRQLRSQVGESQSRVRALKEEESVIKGIYKTPTGFELPSVSIQEALKNAGYYKGTLDGKIGASTRDAIKSFQKDNGMSADGVVGRRTWSKLKSYTEGAAPAQ